MSANYQVLQDDVRDSLPTLPRNYFDCCVTSPPYWKLRKYLPKGHPLEDREIGQEPTPAQYVKTMVGVCGMVRDCLTDRGTLWLNVGDTYSQSGSGGAGKHLATQGATIENRKAKKTPGLQAGNLCLVPQRLMIALQDDGWFVRSVVVWHKPAPMPCSVTGWMWRKCRKKLARVDRGSNFGHGDSSRPVEYASDRPTWADCPGCEKCEPNGGLVLRRGSWRPTSAWEPIIMLAKTANYFADGEPTKTAPAASTIERDKSSRIIDDPDEQYAVSHDHETTCDDGANLRDVWTIKEPLFRLRTDLTPEQRAYVLQRLAEHQRGS